jgi:hypothetical protein
MELVFHNRNGKTNDCYQVLRVAGRLSASNGVADSISNRQRAMGHLQAGNRAAPRFTVGAARQATAPVRIKNGFCR